ncbi:MAG: class beta-lactamase-related serine hydrolase [Mucilaginibacter sp.]|nr:class beta-lactamase-related serine hydrolase [Mucilaginibacter sp.]
MKFKLCLVLFLFISGMTFAQSHQQYKTDSVFVLVKKFFNAKQADSIYTLTGPNFRQAVSEGQFRHLTEQQLFPLNDIKGSSVISFVNNKVSTYKLVFQSVTLQLLMSLDAGNQIELFLFQPYKDVTADKTTQIPTSNKLLNTMDKQVDSVAHAYIQKVNTVGLSIGIIKDGQISTYNYGETARGNNQLPTANTMFEIGSITKTFTATLLAYYANEGKIKLTDPITKYLPDSVKTNTALNAITLLTLSNHTSGLARIPENLQFDSASAANPYKKYNKRQLYSYLKVCKLNSIPGEQYAYSNLGVGLLGTILSQVSGKTFEQMIQEVICNPLGMKNTIQHLSALQLPHFTKVYSQYGDATVAWDFDALAACGALHSTINDLLIYAKANMINGTDKLSKAFDLTHQITYSKDAKIALGWHIILVDGVEYIFHNGGTYGSSSFLAFNADKKLAVVVLSNAAESTDAVGTGIIKKLQGEVK